MMTPYDIRKKWRVKLHAKRVADNDQSPQRYQRDAAVLNRAMAIHKVEGRHAKW